MLLGSLLTVYLLGTFGVSWWARGRINNATDYLVAGRRLPLWLAWPTLFATWFGAGTLLTTTDEVRAHGLIKAALDPIGAGVCLLLAGFFFASRMWKQELLTVPDYFAKRFGPRAELWCAILTVPGYSGWVAAQFAALASVVQLFFGVDPAIGMVLVAIVGTAYTLIGGMWSVTLTDALQSALVLVGIAMLGWVAFSQLGQGSLSDGWRQLSQARANALQLFGDASASAIVTWISLFCAGALGNLPGQDLMQRVFAAGSAHTARNACLIAGIVYLVAGMIPVLTGLAGDILLPAKPDAMLAYMSRELLNPFANAIFLLAIISAVLSTIDSAILAPASVIAQNLLPRFGVQASTIRLSQISIIAVAVSSLALAFTGKTAYDLLASAYEIGLVSLLVPLACGLYLRRGGEKAALLSMALGTFGWLVHAIFDWSTFAGPALAVLRLPSGIGCALVGLAAYLLAARR